jgi:hypothetical protein
MIELNKKATMYNRCPIYHQDYSAIDFPIIREYVDEYTIVKSHTT